MFLKGKLKAYGDPSTLFGKIGIVPDDEQIVVATNNGEPLAGDDSLAGQAYINICHRIIGEEVPFLDLRRKKGFFAKLFGKN